MTREEASKIIKDGLEDMSLDFTDEEQYEALTMAINALSQEPTDDATLKDIFCMGCEYKEQEPRKITYEDVKEYCKPRCLTIIDNALLYELTHPKIKALQEPKSPCDLCRYNPPSSADGKPCTMCPAEGRAE